jgi:hypothetical protein
MYNDRDFPQFSAKGGKLLFNHRELVARNGFFFLPGSTKRSYRLARSLPFGLTSFFLSRPL